MWLGNDNVFAEWSIMKQYLLEVIRGHFAENSLILFAQWYPFTIQYKKMPGLQFISTGTRRLRSLDPSSNSLDNTVP